MEDTRAFNRYLTATKSHEWACEEELRLVDPSFVPDGQSATFLSFHPQELVKVYLGHWFDFECLDEVIDAAQSLNEDVAIFQTKLAKDAYALTFDRIV